MEKPFSQETENENFRGKTNKKLLSVFRRGGTELLVIPRGGRNFGRGRKKRGLGGVVGILVYKPKFFRIEVLPAYE